MHPGCWMIPHNSTAFIYFIYRDELRHHRVKLSFGRTQQKEVNYRALIIYPGTITMVLFPKREVSAAWNEREEEVPPIVCPQCSLGLNELPPPTSCKYIRVFSVNVAHVHDPRAHTIERSLGTGIVLPQCQCQSVTLLEEMPPLCSPPCKDEST